MQARRILLRNSLHFKLNKSRLLNYKGIFVDNAFLNYLFDLLFEGLFKLLFFEYIGFFYSNNLILQNIKNINILPIFIPQHAIVTQFFYEHRFRHTEFSFTSILFVGRPAYQDPPKFYTKYEPTTLHTLLFKNLKRDVFYKKYKSKIQCTSYINYIYIRYFFLIFILWNTYYNQQLHNYTKLNFFINNLLYKFQFWHFIKFIKIHLNNYSLNFYKFFKYNNNVNFISIKQNSLLLLIQQKSIFITSYKLVNSTISSEILFNIFTYYKNKKNYKYLKSFLYNYLQKKINISLTFEESVDKAIRDARDAVILARQSYNPVTTRILETEKRMNIAHLQRVNEYKKLGMEPIINPYTYKWKK